MLKITFLHNRGNLGAKSFLIFAGCMAICLVFTFFYLPEVKGRTPAELDEMFQERVPARKFKGQSILLNVHRNHKSWLTSWQGMSASSRQSISRSAPKRKLMSSVKLKDQYIKSKWWTIGRNDSYEGGERPWLLNAHSCSQFGPCYSILPSS